MIESGPHIKSENFKKQFYYSLKNLWKSSGYQYANGNISLPILQGTSLGGSTTINGSIMQTLDKTFCDKIIKEANIKINQFNFENLLKYQAEIKEEFNINSGSDKFLKETGI